MIAGSLLSVLGIFIVTIVDALELYKLLLFMELSTAKDKLLPRVVCIDKRVTFVRLLSLTCCVMFGVTSSLLPLILLLNGYCSGSFKERNFVGTALVGATVINCKIDEDRINN
jgi:hypothetical protein